MRQEYWSSFTFVIECPFRDALCNIVNMCRRFIYRVLIVAVQCDREAAFHHTWHFGPVVFRSVRLLALFAGLVVVGQAAKGWIDILGQCDCCRTSFFTFFLLFINAWRAGAVFWVTSVCINILIYIGCEELGAESVRLSSDTDFGVPCLTSKDIICGFSCFSIFVAKRFAAMD